ncbi:dodecin [Marinobacterium weihaiense]|uniref:Dodecin family protein n=1 Tax=Marinobacterium weihaiense TaxID=2851016 RepID=A0ABS6M965_9GAMM|nr:dodecin [Marinobacterium weihaiense]MBV0932828.1 dodecin family protein [Marinobacterium weihaiense]
MNEHIYKIVEVAGSSTESHDDAIRNAIAKAAETIDHLNWYEVKEMRGHIADGSIAHYQVVVRLGFRLE